jgi:glycerophosphoryl diester phosphodiesterase
VRGPALGLGLVVGLAALAGAASVGGGPGTGSRVAAHRGGALLWPENSLLAFRRALALGVDFVETDVHLTADDEVVVLHDPTLERTTTGAGAVRDRRLSELVGLRLRDRDARPTDEPVPTLAQLLDLLQPTRAGLLLEIKVDAQHRRYPGIEEKVLALVRGHGLERRTLAMAFERETVARLRALDPAIGAVLLVGRRQLQTATPVECVGWAAALGASHLGLFHAGVDAAVMTAARRDGLRVGAWTVNEEAEIRRLLELGVDLVISDRPDLALRLAGR